MLESLEYLKSCVLMTSNQPDNRHSGHRRIKLTLKNTSEGNMYCSSCGDIRRMTVSRLFPEIDQNQLDQLELNTFQRDRDNYIERVMKDVNNLITPSLWRYNCLQCKSYFTTIIYYGSLGQSLAVMPNRDGGLTTPNTPNGVAYYLDQASKAQSIGANSASMAMYRAALEHILFEQGFTTGMLGQKLKALNEAIYKGQAPK